VSEERGHGEGAGVHATLITDLYVSVGVFVGDFMMESLSLQCVFQGSLSSLIG
jgi:hypothetical protein